MKIADIQVTPINPERWGNDLDVVNAARVSFDKASSWEWDEQYCEFKEGSLKAADVKLIHYLAKHKHHSPFNHSFLSFRIKAPIFVARQLVKHKFMPWNEVSRRYVDSEPEFYVPGLWRKKSENVKQGSSEENILIRDEDGYCPFDHNTWCANELYRDLINRGVCPEQARMVLPQNTMTEWIWSGTLGAFIDMLRLRLDPHTQKESRGVAQLIAEHVKVHFPVSYSANLE